MAGRTHNPICGLEPEARDTVTQMLLGGGSYADVSVYLAGRGLHVGIETVSEFAATLNADVAALRRAQNDLRRMMAEVERCPALDTADAMLRLASRQVLRTLSDTGEDAGAEIDRAIHAAVGLVNAAAYKKRADFAVRQQAEIGLARIRQTVFAALMEERPALYRELRMFLDQKEADFAGMPADERR